MKKSSLICALAWRALTLAACVAGLCILFNNGDAGSLMRYFTVQSNIIVALCTFFMLLGTLIRLIKNGGRAFEVLPPVQLGVTFIITITFLVYAFMLADSGFSMRGAMGVSNLLVHYVAPVMSILDWLIFMSHGRVKIRHAALWLIYPAFYVALSFILAYAGPRLTPGSRFPYFFMDADALGLNLFWIAPAFFAAYFALGCVYVGIDKLLGRALHTEDATAGTLNI